MMTETAMNTTTKQPKLYDLSLYYQAGINPKTGLPRKWDDGSLNTPELKTETKKHLRIKDEQQAINRFTWHNLPKGLNSRLMERILYYRGQGMFFKLLDLFYFLPYTLYGEGLDVYGRYMYTTPLPFNGSSSSHKENSKKDDYKPWISGLKRKCMYDVQIPEDYIDSESGEILVEKILDTQEESCVLIKDYTEQIAQKNIPRQELQDSLIDEMSNMIPFMHTALLNSTGVDGMRVNSQDEYANVEAASRSINRAALEGKKWVPIVGNIDFQKLTDGQPGKVEEFLLAMQALDNHRLSLYGLDNGGLFQKKSHMLQDEMNMNSCNSQLVLRDSLQNRQDACDIINSIWGLNVWVELTEILTGIDLNGDMMLGGNEQLPENKYDDGMDFEASDVNNVDEEGD